ncbi:MAG: hypothetical protein Q9222_004902 [Ikaeria aurantiellina]
MAYVETPRTDAGNSTYMPNGYGLDDISAENTFLSPGKKELDLVSQLRKNRAVSVKTPRSRLPFGDRRNQPVAPINGEFTPLLKSVAKQNLQKGVKLNGVPATPAFLKHGFKGMESPALPAATPAAYSENTGSSVGAIDNETPVPHMANSSAQATPLATLPKRNAEGVLTDQGNVLTLREQENIINKIEKENFGLKLKIHFLEESLRKSGPGFNEMALKENTDLKVDKITMQKELQRARKTLDRTEREVEDYRDQLQNAHDQAKRNHADKRMLEELEALKQNIAAKDSQILEMREELDRADQKDSEIDRLNGEIDDLEIDIREKDRLLDDRDDEFESLKEQSKRDSDRLAEALEKIETGSKRIRDLEVEQQALADQSAQFHRIDRELTDAQRQIQDLNRKINQAEERAENAERDTQEARQAKAEIEDDLQEVCSIQFLPLHVDIDTSEQLRDEMSNKSFSTKGLSRQLEEKVHRLQSELAELQEKGSQSHQEARRQRSRLEDEKGELRQKLETVDQKCRSLTDELQETTRNLQRQSEEKDLLHSRHDALTSESQGLQKDLIRKKATIEELEASLEAERSHALENDRQLREEAEDEIRQLSDEISSLQRDLDEKDSQHTAERDLSESQRRGLESERDRAAEQCAGLQRTINKLHDVEGTLSGREHNLQEALESEKQRHASQEASLKRDLEDLDADVSDKRKQLADLRSEIARINEELRVGKRNEGALEEKVQALEDEINVLQDNLEEENARAKDEASTRQNADSLRRQLNSAKKDCSQAETALADVRAELETFRSGLQGSQDQLNARLLTLESDLRQVKSERQSLQDKLAKSSLETHELRSSLENAEAERDQVRSQLEHMESQLNKTSVRDQEKSDLRKARLRLETEITQMREERDALLEKNQAIEREIEDEIRRASLAENKLNEEIAELRRKTNASDDARSNPELSMLQEDLLAARRRETDFLQREFTQKEAVRSLKLKVTRLERQAHEAELARLTVDSPKPSGDSGQKTEVAELRNQLSSAHQQLKELRSKSRDTEKALHRQLNDAEQVAQSNLAAIEQEREQAEQELSSVRHEQESEQARLAAAEKIISRLRSRASGLESSLRDARNNYIGDRTMADERKDLHEMLKDAKLEAEDLQLQISTRELNLRTAATREQELRTHLRRVRDERTEQQQKSAALATELESLQSRYERAVEDLSRQRKEWEAERKAINSRVRFANTSVSENRGGAEEVQNMQLVVQEKERRHASELDGMVTQIQWLRWKLEREMDFRRCLVFEKCYLSTQVKINKLDLLMFKKKLGIDVAAMDGPRPPPKKHVRTVAWMIIFTLRCKRYADEWTEQKKVKTRLNKALEVARRAVLMKQIQAKGWER